MPIPRSIQAIHIAKAIKDLKKTPYDPKRASTEYVLLVDGVALEPKRLITRAAYYAIGRELPSTQFSGGNETNDFLEDRGFKVCLGATK